MLRSKCLLTTLAAVLALPTLAAAATYKIDPQHTYPSIETSHMGISVWRGKFTKTEGTLTYDKAAKTGTVDVTIDAASMDFGHQKLEEELRGDKFFDVAKYPTIKYQGKLVFKDGEPEYVDGQLTLHGVTKPVRLEIEEFKCIEHPFYKKEVCGADAEADINRADFGMTFYADGEMGKVHLQIQVEGLKEG